MASPRGADRARRLGRARACFLCSAVLLIMLYAFNRSNVAELADAGLHDEVVPRRLARPPGARRILAVDPGRARRDRDRAPARLARAFALHRFRFFGRELISFLLVLPIALPGIITGMALNSFFTSPDIQLSLWTIVIGHATFCVVVVYNNVIARLRRDARLARRGVDGPRRERLADLPLRHTAGDRDGARLRRAARLRAVVRRGGRDRIHRRARRTHCRCGSSG